MSTISDRRNGGRNKIKVGDKIPGRYLSFNYSMLIEEPEDGDH